MRLDIAMIDGGNEPTPITDSPRNAFAAQIAALTPESVASVPAPTFTQSAKLTEPNSPGLETIGSSRGLSQDQIDAQAAVADARANAEETAKMIGGTVDANGMVVMPAKAARKTYSELTPAERAAMTPEQKLAYIHEDTIARQAAATAGRISDPMTDPTHRPTFDTSELPDELKGMIYYYGWVGGASSGKWTLYRAVDNAENQAKYGALAFGGPTQATLNSAVGANALKVQPQWNQQTGTWYAVDGSGTIAPKGTTSTAPTTSTTTTPTTSTVTKPVTSATTSTATTTSTSSTTTPPNLTLVSTSTDPVTNAVIGYFSDGSQKTLSPGVMSKVETDAYALLKDTFANYGLDSLTPVIEEYMKQNLGPQQAAVQLKQSEPYLTRFKGNQLRIAAGMNALTESEYLALENSYNSTLQAYGLNGFFGTSRDQEIAGMAKVIGGGVNAAEFTSRVSTVVDRVMNADPNIKKTLTSFYNITDADLVKYYLDPSKDNLAALNLKTTAAEIGTAATEQGLTTGVTSATALAQAGVTGAQAQKGYATIGQIVPETQKLSSIYGEAKVGYDQAAAEAEVFGTTGAASAARKRKQLADLETQAFQGRSGIQQQVNPLGKGLQGSF
jgi:hypothetical protein